MGNKREARRTDLQNRLIAAAEAQIAETGLAGVKAREVTARAGCALGALYTAFDDVDMLVLHVNSRTLARLGEALKTARATCDGTPEEVLQALAAEYVRFARDNRRLWSALFEHRLPEGVEPPTWHKRDHAVLIEEIIAPLGALRPDLSSKMLLMRARTTFAAVHGVVQLSLQGRFVGVPPDSLAAEVTALVDAMVRGAHLARPGA
ncbi:TetR-like C-terminal domain-containing protein [Defluviimonas sp. D31]|uniref:TetR-like C-terminal domain-containing protein n=1 Tax=Defluviimonas sp. D31 TaxID=3083253 RepID=UPI00296E6881|nr:TetR-like C-terminal domain-containing protein [Defluviimonas sp. D31]MDW4550611.1 TetR-like C-terminal domain-containing protein [Defluviimonas sp. D31]